jgi:putative phosphoesterase
VRLGIVSDVHADVHALADALTQARHLGCELVVCAGDLVDDGLHADDTIDLLRAHEIPTICGNHDRWAVRSGVDLDGRALAPATLAYLRSLPTHFARVIADVRLVMWHAQPDSDMHGLFPDSPEERFRELVEETGAAVYISGHTHIPMRVDCHGCMFVNPGALSRHRDPSAPDARRPGGTFGVLDLSPIRFTLHRAVDGAEVPFPDG